MSQALMNCVKLCADTPQQMRASDLHRFADAADDQGICTPAEALSWFIRNSDGVSARTLQRAIEIKTEYETGNGAF